ncbi:hypothetical protein [Heliorestis convoluta]|uniref:Poly(3-hydroxyalkanoate) polymerase subunit PhaE n=1 Tax=Heliorestis convoluta TaxID=356322 RepID=A0A5Q2N2E8_9FIRM|nr:hypothetical protein [Heliorestis convoluta]QGG46745.1 hypothetical protein FTV88_0566 [Heliorestis convoluta]
MSHHKNLTEEQVDEFFKQMKKMYETSEEQWTKVWENVLTSESYGNFLGVTGTQTMFFREMMKRNMESMLKAASMPSEEEMANVARQVIKTEEKVDDLAFRMDDLSDELQEKVYDKVNQLSEQMEEVHSTLRLLARKMQVYERDGNH